MNVFVVIWHCMVMVMVNSRMARKVESILGSLSKQSISFFFFLFHYLLIAALPFPVPGQQQHVHLTLFASSSSPVPDGLTIQKTTLRSR